MVGLRPKVGEWMKIRKLKEEKEGKWGRECTHGGTDWETLRGTRKHSRGRNMRELRTKNKEAGYERTKMGP